MSKTRTIRRQIPRTLLAVSLVLGGFAERIVALKSGL